MVSGEIHVGVRQYHGVVLGAAEGLHPLAPLAGAPVHVEGDRSRADERDRGYLGMIEQGVDGHLVAVHDVEDAVGQPGAGVQLGDQDRRRRVPLAGLQHEGVAGRDRDRVHPHRHHDREVERGDAGAHAEGLAQRVRVDIGGHLARVLALQQLREPAGELDHLKPADRLALGVGDHLAMLGGNDPGEVIEVTLDQVAEAEHDPDPPGKRDVLPRLEGLRGRPHRLVDVGRVGEHDTGLDLPGSRVVHVSGGGGRTRGRSAANPMLDGLHDFLVIWFRSQVAALRAFGLLVGAPGRPGAFQDSDLRDRHVPPASR